MCTVVVAGVKNFVQAPKVAAQDASCFRMVYTRQTWLFITAEIANQQTGLVVI